MLPGQQGIVTKSFRTAGSLLSGDGDFAVDCDRVAIFPIMESIIDWHLECLCPPQWPTDSTDLPFPAWRPPEQLD